MIIENAVFMSIKDIHVNNIITKQKNHEFRTIKPIKDINYILVYVPTPIKELQYILEVEKFIEFPNKLIENGIGNNSFNNSDKYKLAYPIKHLYELKEKINLKSLKNEFNFTAPQSFAYGEKYLKLIKFIEKKGYTKLY